MKNVTLYPKTERIGDPEYQITEKLDGSNIGFFNVFGDLLIAQRNAFFKLSELDSVDGTIYRGLKVFLKEHGKDLLSRLYEGSGFFGEWMGNKNQIKYGMKFEKMVYIFGKANIVQNYEDDYEITNLYWRRDLLKYPFKNAEIPEYLGLTPLVAITPEISIPALDKLYDDYREKVGRPVEGFVVLSQNGKISKYVRNKSGKVVPHTKKGGGDE